MALPNTTPTPNELFNGEMKKMTDAELRVVMLVTRATFGWILDDETGMRKEEDWISHSQMVERTGKSSRAVSYAITNCVEKGWIETRGEKGQILKTAHERKLYGKKIYYRLGPVFLNRVRTIANGAKVPSHLSTQTIANDDTEPSQSLLSTKKTITKEKIQKSKAANAARHDPLGSEVIKAFQAVDPKNKNYYGNTTQRKACDFLLKEYGLDAVLKRISVLPKTNKVPFFPRITSPYELQEKWQKLEDAVAVKRSEAAEKQDKYKIAFV